MVIPLIIACLKGSVAIKNPPHLDQSAFLKLDDEAFSDMIETLKMAESYNKKLEEKRVAAFSKGVQQASMLSDGVFSFPGNCTPTNQAEDHPYCFHGSITENETTQVNATVNFFDLYDSEETTMIGLKTTYKDEEVQKLDVNAGGKAELVSFGNKSTAAASIFLATHVEELYNPAQLGIMRNSFVSQVHFNMYAYGYLVMNMETIPIQRSDVFAGKSYNVGFNMSASYEKGLPYSLSAGASIVLSLQTVKNDLHKWKLLGIADAFVKTPISTFHFPYTYISDVISI